MESYKERTLREAMEAAGVRQLPPRCNPSDIWIYAIVLVRKLDCTQNYALASRRGDGRIKVFRDFGRMSPIAGIASVHPYMYLDTGRFLVERHVDGQETMSEDARKAALVDLAIEEQLERNDAARVEDGIDSALAEMAHENTRAEGDFDDLPSEVPTSRNVKARTRFKNRNSFEKRHYGETEN